MAEDTLDASLIEWEDGVDLVLGISADRTPAQIWPHLTDPRLVDTWFVGFEPGPERTRLHFTFDDEPVPGEVISSETPDADSEEAHLLVEIEGIGRLGITLRCEGGTAPTRISLAHTVGDPDTDPELIASVVEQVGPVWETHLRLLAADLASEAGDDSSSYDVPEAELTARYQRLAADFA